VRLAVFVVALSIGLGAQSAYVPERVFDPTHHGFTDFETMTADVATADVVFVGEQHDDANTHRLELAVLEGVARRRGGVVVGFEMFERDVQKSLDHFQMGHLTEKEFLAASRPWPNYDRDYKPLLDFAVLKQWPVFASNVPRPLATEVSKAGLNTLKTKSGDQAKWFAKDLNCIASGDYFKRFSDAMTEHPPASTLTAPVSESAAPASSAAPPASASAPRTDPNPESIGRYFQAQCLRDATMGESVALAYETAAMGGLHPLVVHFNGAFHTDFAEGTAERTKRRLPGKRIVVLSVLPVDNLDALSPGKTDRKRADYLVYTMTTKK
jgi:uncharacterized iron-regulated protein